MNREIDVVSTVHAEAYDHDNDPAMRDEPSLSRPAADPVQHPPHYTSHPSGVECIAITEHMNFNIGNAIKYLWRAGLKGAAVQDLRKAAWYVNREIDRIARKR